MDNIVGGRCSVSQIIQLRRYIFSKNIYIFRHLKLEIALAIPASNDEKYNWSNSAGQRLRNICQWQNGGNGKLWVPDEDTELLVIYQQTEAPNWLN